MFICMQKIIFIIHFFLEILHFKESLELDWSRAFWLRYGTDDEISKLVSVVMLEYSQEKLMTKFFKKSKKNLLGLFWALFSQSWAKMNFPGKKGFVSF